MKTTTTPNTKDTMTANNLDPTLATPLAAETNEASWMTYQDAPAVTTDNEFDEIDENDIELGDEDERPFPDSDEEIRALQDVAEAVDELEAEIAELRTENKRLRALLEMKEETQ